MWFTKTEDGFRGWIVVGNDTGTLETNLSSGSFVATVRDPDDTESYTPTVVESGKPGLYRFDISSSFFEAHGPGGYGCVVEVSEPGVVADVISHVVMVSLNDIDTVYDNIEYVRQATCGRWKIEDNKMKFYKEDNVTLLMEFDLYDQSGNPTMQNVFDRTRL
jgi:hypothetical protein